VPSAHPGKGKEGREVKAKVEKGYGQRLGWSGAGTGKGCLVLKNSLKSPAMVRKQDTLRTADAPLTAPLTAGPCSLSLHTNSVLSLSATASLSLSVPHKIVFVCRLYNS